MLSQSNGQTVPQFGCSIGKCSDTKVFFVVSLVDTGDAKTRHDGGLQMTCCDLRFALMCPSRRLTGRQASRISQPILGKRQRNVLPLLLKHNHGLRQSARGCGRLLLPLHPRLSNSVIKKKKKNLFFILSHLVG